MKARSGRIINMSSAAGRMGNPGQANYAAAKAAIVVDEDDGRELAGRGVTCNAIAPGLIETDLTADLPEAATDALTGMTPMGRIGLVDDGRSGRTSRPTRPATSRSRRRRRHRDGLWGVRSGTRISTRCPPGANRPFGRRGTCNDRS